jgi:hypothetical protein
MKLFACDFDGTLYRNGAVADADREACRLARERGHRFGIVTGRGATTLQRELARFDLPCDFSICNNGALVLDGAGRELGRTELACSLRSMLLRHPAVARASHCALFDGTRMRVLEGKRGYWVNPRYPMPAVSLGEALEDRLQQISLAFPSRGEAEAEAEGLRRAAGGEALVLCSLSLVDVVAAGAGKSAGLRSLLRLWGMGPESVVALGDDGNDIDMLRDFGGFAMAGSAKAVLEAGRGVAASVGEIVRRFL